jgi:hypothetical protein
MIFAIRFFLHQKNQIGPVSGPFHVDLNSLRED